MQQWAKDKGIQLDFIQPGQPQQNAYIEQYNRTVRYDWLVQTLFDSIDEVQDAATRWLRMYNNERPHTWHVVVLRRHRNSHASHSSTSDDHSKWGDYPGRR